MTRSARKVACGVLLAAAGLVGAFGLDHVLSRPDRKLYAHRKNEMLSVYDQVLRYELENLELPRTLDELAPNYLRQDQIAPQGAPLYSYDRTNRTLALASGQAVRGLIRRTLPPAVLALPARAADKSHGRIAEVSEHAFAPRGPQGLPPPAGSLVFEAEHYTEMNYGWEVHADTACGGGAYAYSKEGIANGPGQTRHGVFDFYNIHEKPEMTRIRWHIHVPRNGRYYLCGRIWTTGSHCSNSIRVGMDGAVPQPDGEEQGSSLGNRTPFRWRWETAADGPVRITAGDHYLEAFLHEDGVLVDQFALSPVPLTGDAVYAANVIPVDRDTAFRQQPGAPITLAFDLQTMVLSTETNPVCNLTIRKLRPVEGMARIRLWLTHAGTNGTDLALGEYALNLCGTEELLFMPVNFGGLNIAALPRREYLLVAEATRQQQVIAHAHIPLCRPCRWEVCGPFDSVQSYESGPLDADDELPRGAAQDQPWKPFRDSCFNFFGVLDFGLQTVTNSLHAPQGVMIYARTEIHVPKTGSFLMKVASDDQMRLWCDGRLIYRCDTIMPVTRSAERRAIRLEEGRHRLRMRVNNARSWDYADGTWQAVLRFRTVDDDLSDVTGL